MDAGGNFALLADEKFDFDISLSPTSAKEEHEECDDEVFIGPVKHKEKCISAAFHNEGVPNKNPSPLNTEVNWSPLSGDKFVEIFKEAHLVALQLECLAADDQKKDQLTPAGTKPAVEKFVQESKSKLKMFENKDDNKTPIVLKRETYCVQDSPFHQLPPSIQQRVASGTGETKSPKNTNPPSPVQAHKLSKVSDSSEDVFSDKSSVASDISDSSFNSSIVGQNKRVLPASSKVSLKRTQFKAPSSSGTFRKNTSSSSSSHSSLNTSLNSSLPMSSPGNAKLNASLNVSINGSRIKSNSSRLMMGRPSGSISSVKTVTEMSKGLLRPSSAVKLATAGNANKSSSVSVAQPLTPAGKIQRQTSAPNLHRLPVPNKPDSFVKSTTNSRPQARVLPTPTSRLKLPQRMGGVSPDRPVLKSMQPTRLMSCSEIGSVISESTPMKSTQAIVINTSTAAKSVSATPSSKHISALPTPLSRRTSGAIMTPRTIPRSISSLRPTLSLQASAKSAKRLPTNRLVESKANGGKETTSPGSSNEEDTSTPAVIPCSLKFSPETKNIHIEEDLIEPLSCPLSKEILLDFEEKKHERNVKVKKHLSAENDSYPLIDLSNTPELNKIVIPLKPTHVDQLIDLSSPLINLSPVLNKENLEIDSPLMKF
ncbi:hypothetical protein GDO86_005890 [Hymenochirus boettgeri]|uniref:G2 and S phase-expressed protein 1 N-terminal domain-containing protein n=1 Tax=Hymenochirus boettgeri TaxID=247094 RepID=A0A8T2JBT8_9PIPI|nr:hypothetical protein GDO86_005890 [Hymenochirus boettgeri]